MLDQEWLADKRLHANLLEVSVAELEDAVRCGDLEQIAVHLSAGISPNYRTPKYGALVATAASEQQLGSLSALLTAGARLILPTSAGLLPCLVRPAMGASIWSRCCLHTGL